MRFAFFGDVVGKSGRDGLADHLPGLRRRLGLEFVIVNAENAAAGFGITENTARELFDAGADCLTLGNHSWDQKEALTYIVREPRLIRPANYPILSDAPGKGSTLFQTASGRTIMVINLLGRVHMDAMDDPFAAVDRELDKAPLGQVADVAGVSRRAISMYEEGMSAMVEVAERLEAFFDEALVEPADPHAERGAALAGGVLPRLRAEETIERAR